MCESETADRVFALRRKKKIFEPFLTTKENGNGIGLWITKRLVDTLEGTIIVEEPEGGGAEFSVFIPVEKREVDR